ncbi:hypothetical protein GF354_03820 [Candidatus Peregrinibacteria bacterium]|nr:hypothetical protein [Candidatus Peregrinibacteria bacterium]
MKKLRKFLAAAGIISIMLSSMSLGVFAQQDGNGPFPDVDEDHENEVAIQFMKDNEVFSGYPDGTFGPDTVLNRAEQLKVYILMHGFAPDETEYNNCFPDVKEEWFARFVCFAKEQGWVQGYEDGTYKPAKEVNKVEALKMLGEIQGWQMETPEEDTFSDTPKTEWYAKYVEYAHNSNFLMEEGDTFEPGGGLKRAHTAELLFRSLSRLVLGKDAYNDDQIPDLLPIDIAQMDIFNVQVVENEAPLAEFGDAPEGEEAGYAGSYSSIEAKFPTLYNTVYSLYGPGAHALDSSMEWLGDPDLNQGYSYEMDANDATDPDGVQNLVNADGYDDGVRGLNVTLTQIPPPATLTVDVTVEDDAPDVPRYLNVLIDLNMDGKWKGTGAGGEPEWVVKNFVVNVAPGTTETITTDEFAYSNGLMLTPTTWMRVVLSRNPIDAAAYRSSGWDGSGVFEYGEVEDYYIQLPDWDDGSGGSGGGAGGPGGGGRGLVWGKPAPVMICPAKVIFPTGANAVRFSCSVFNFGGAGDVEYTFWWISGGVTILPPLIARFAMPTAPPGFFAPGFPGGVAGVVGNPTRRWFTAVKGTTPSTWGYKIVGIDPLSTVKDSIVDLGLVPGDKDEKYEAGDLEDIVSWYTEVDDIYLTGTSGTGPRIMDATFVEMESGAGTYHYSVVGHVEDADTDTSDLDFSWSNPNGCGTLEGYDNILDWTFAEADYYDCLSGGLILTVSDGSMSDTMHFEDVFEVEEPVNQEPIVEDFIASWLNTVEDDPHVYNLSVYADDPEGGELTYNWTDITCGSFVGSTTQQTVQWEYALADMEACGAAEATVEITDDEGLTLTYTTAVFN